MEYLNRLSSKLDFVVSIEQTRDNIQWICDVKELSYNNPPHRGDSQQGLITSTNKILQQAIKSSITQEMPAVMRDALQKNVFFFSGMKTHAEMREASALLTDDDGNLKPLSKFIDDVKTINDTYNDNYLRAERNFAVRSSQAADKWQKFEQGKDRYDLRYMTMMDDRVRPEHQELEGITLPVSDPFWDKYTPPNGYNCRCQVIQVRKGEYDVSDSEDAMTRGNKATTVIGKDGKNKAAIFRFNPGKEMKVMPPDHPYTSGSCGGLHAVWQTLSVMQKIQLAGQADKCRAKKVVEEMVTNKSAVAKKRQSFINEMEPLLDKSITRYVGSDKHIRIGFSKKGNHHIADDILSGINNTTKKELSTLNERLKKAEYIRSSELYKKRKDDIQRFYYFKDKNKDFYYHVAEAAEKRSNGRINLKRYLYSISKDMPEK